MADDVAPTREVASPSNHFRGIATSTGMKMKNALQQDTSPASKTPVYVSFDVDRYQDDLKELMDQFKEKVGRSNIVYGRTCGSTFLAGIQSETSTWHACLAPNIRHAQSYIVQR